MGLEQCASHPAKLPPITEVERKTFHDKKNKLKEYDHKASPTENIGRNTLDYEEDKNIQKAMKKIILEQILCNAGLRETQSTKWRQLINIISITD